MIVSPTFLIDETRCRINIREMAQKANKNQVVFRPHFKTHQSLQIASWFREEAVHAITVSSLKMAQCFINDGWDDVTLAFPVNIRAMDWIRQLSEKAKLHLVIESNSAIEALEKGLTNKTKIFIKIDTGYGRTGVPSTQKTTIDNLVSQLSKSSKLSFSGFLSHAGHSYNARSAPEIAEIHHASHEALSRLKDHYIKQHPNLLLSVGDTPSCSVMDDFTTVDEIRPGNFVFFDLMQELIGSCTPDQIAVAVACPIVAIHRERNEMVVHGGGVHFSKESIEDPVHGIHYGQVTLPTDQEELWGQPAEGAYLRKLSQEHGTIVASPAFIDRCQIGDLLKILPVHSCMTANLMKESTLIVSC